MDGLICDPGLNAESLLYRHQEISASWLDRSVYWQQKAENPSRRDRHASVRKPLILSGHGVKLRIDRGTLLVQNGFTHYPQKRETWRFFSGDWRLPSRIIVLDVDGSISFDVLSWLSRHDLPLIHLNWLGEVVNVVGATPSAANPTLRNAQLAAAEAERNLRIAQGLLTEKIGASIETLRSVFPQSDAVDQTVSNLRQRLSGLKENPLPSIAALLGIEGAVAQAYFGCWANAEVQWTNTQKQPIPDEWRCIGRRTSKISTKAKPNRNATHPVNAMLNYAYGVLETQVRTEIIAAGLDPMIGIFHGGYREKLSLVYDLMEPLRPIVDRQVLAFVRKQVFSSADFTLLDTGVCRLHPQLARQVVSVVSVADKAELLVQAFIKDMKAR